VAVVSFERCIAMVRQNFREGIHTTLVHTPDTPTDTSGHIYDTNLNRDPSSADD